MLKPSPRRDVLLSALLHAIGLAIAIIAYLHPAKPTSGWVFHHLGVFSLPLFAAGFGGIAHAVVKLAMGVPWRPGASHPMLLPWLRRYRKPLVFGITAFCGAVFGTLSIIATRLPKPRGTQYVWQYEVLRLGALLAGVTCLIGFLSLMLPAVLNLLERRSFTAFVSARHVRATKSGFLTVISVLSICGVAVSSCALVSVVSIMGGFGQDLKRKILGNNAHITIDTQAHAGFEDWDSVLNKVRLVPGVAAATPVVSGEAMVSSQTNTAGVMVRGIVPDSIGNVIDLRKNIEVGRFEYLTDPEKLRHLPPDEVIGLGPGGEPYLRGPDLGDGSWFGGTAGGGIDPDIKDALRSPTTRPGVVIGRELAKTLHVYVGDEVSLISPLGDLGPMGVLPRVRKFSVAAVFYSGMYEYDATHVYVLMDVAQDLFSIPDRITNIDIRAVDGERASAVRPLVAQAVERPELRVRDWRELNKNLFSALKLERIATFIILSIAIAVASFCIICTLLLMVTEKGKEIAILKALGTSSSAIMRIFMLEGIIIGCIGTAFGVATGAALCRGLAWYGLRLDPEVYYIDRLPIENSWADCGLVAICAMAICTVATIYPALAGSKLHPVQALRYE